MSDKHNGTAPAPSESPPRLVIVRRTAGFTAAASMSLYLAVKAVWVLGTLAGAAPRELEADLSDWIALNTVTIAMAVLGVTLGLALAQPWGMRIPAPLVLLFAWTAAGFLVSLLPYTVLSALLDAAGISAEAPSGPDAGESVLPAWETALITVGFAGMALGLLVAVPLYMRERWPRAFTGTTGGLRPAARPPRALSVTASVAAGVSAVAWMYWAAGGTAGLNPAARELWNLDVRLLTATSALWAVLGVWSVWALSGPGPARVRLWMPVTVGFVASGSLFAWNAWRVLWVVFPVTSQEPLKTPVVAIAEHLVAMAAGLTMIALLLHVCTRQTDERQ
ncbi:hypothetical protein [Glycomyces sp. NPDC047010]|uniref:hypothetical protein n=1 Tax=Glycomyces sp. NPDC047010 TaxID=3155023 RepID=UPI003405E900